MIDFIAVRFLLLQATAAGQRGVAAVHTPNSGRQANPYDEPQLGSGDQADAGDGSDVNRQVRI
jgi:hypothetical protein